LLTCSFFQLLRCQNTYLALPNSVFGASYLKKNYRAIIPIRVIRDALEKIDAVAVLFIIVLMVALFMIFTALKR